MRKAWRQSVAFFPLVSSLRKKAHAIVVLMYHEILKDTEEIEAWTVVRESAFRDHMEHLRRHYRIISLDESLQWMKAPPQQKEDLAVVTFDDGYSGNARVMLPIVEEMKIPVTVFIATGAVQDQVLYWYDRVIVALQPGSKGEVRIDLNEFELTEYSFGPRDRGERRWTKIQKVLTDLKTLLPGTRAKAMASILHQCEGPPQNVPAILSPLSVTSLQILAASPWVTIGAHSHCHNILIQLEKEQMAQTILESKTLLERWTGRTVRHFAYPNGDYNQEVVDQVREAGFTCSLATHARAWKESDSLFAIPRLGVGRYDSLHSFRGMLAGS